MQKPTSVVVFGVLNIAFGAMALCSFPCALGAQFIPQPANGPQFGNIMTSTPFLRGFLMASLLVGFVMAVWEVVGGIGLVRSRSWGRTLSIAHACATVGVALISMVLSVLVVAPAMQQALQGISDPVVRKTMSLMPYITIFQTCFSLLYPVLLLFFMYRPNVREYFAAVAEADAGGQPLHPPEDELPPPPEQNESAPQ